MSDARDENSTPLGALNADEAASAVSRNTLWNLLGAGIPLMLALLTFPILIRTIGTERFGVLAIVWVVLGYFGLFDLGLGRATTRFVARDLEEGREVSARVNFWTSLLANGALGVLGALVLGTLTPALTERVLDIPAHLDAEARAAFFLMSLSVPLMTLTTAARGAIEARHGFRLLNTLQLPLSVATYAIPLLVLPFSVSLAWITAGLLLSRLVGAVVFLVAALGQFDSPVCGPFFDRNRLRAMLSYGGWLTVTNVVGPFMVYADRLVIGALGSMSAVTYYTTPYEAVTRLWILPHSLTRTLFPIFSSMTDLRRRTKVYIDSSRRLTLIMGPVVATGIVFAPDLLRLWLGERFAVNSTLVLQILAVGILANSLALLPFNLIQGLGRADVTAKFHLLELPLYAVMLWFGVKFWGIPGAAAAWTARTTLDGLLLFGYVRMTKRTDDAIQSGFLQALLLALGLVSCAWGLSLVTESYVLKLGAWGVILCATILYVRRYSLTPSEKDRIFKVLDRAPFLRAARIGQRRRKQG